MPGAHVSIWQELAGKLGPPILAGTIVGCTVAKRVDPSHWVLFAVGLALVAWSHFREHHSAS